MSRKGQLYHSADNDMVAQAAFIALLFTA